MSNYADGIEVDAVSRADLRQFAGNIRASLGLKDEEPFPVMLFFEMVLPMVYDDFTYVVKPQFLMGPKHGETYPQKHCITLRQDVYDGACAGKGRDLYTVMHEVGHLLLHNGQYSLARRGHGQIPLFKNSEWQADAFAGEILMPYNAIKGMSPETVMGLYGVTRSAAETQLRAVRR